MPERGYAVSGAPVRSLSALGEGLADGSMAPCEPEIKCPARMGDSPRIHPFYLSASLHRYPQELQSAFQLNCPAVVANCRGCQFR